jgi:uncharacterized protein (DUF1778 family)
MSSAKSTARINFRLRGDLKKTIEDAAAAMLDDSSNMPNEALVKALKR